MRDLNKYCLRGDDVQPLPMFSIPVHWHKIAESIMRVIRIGSAHWQQQPNGAELSSAPIMKLFNCRFPCYARLVNALPSAFASALVSQLSGLQQSKPLDISIADQRNQWIRH